MKFKAIFLDVDGTILSSQRTILPSTKTILSQLHQQGVLITVVTARPPDATWLIFKQLEMPDNPIICFNGGLIEHQNKFIADYSISATMVQQIKEAIQHFDINFTLYHYRDWLVEKIDGMVQRESDVTATKISVVNFNEEKIKQLNIHKILCMGNPSQIEQAEAFLKSEKIFPINLNRSKSTYLEIVNQNASKMLGVKKVMELYGLTTNEIITIGDYYNDIDMLQFAKTSIAMGNAPDDVKKYATIVTDTNNNDGIAKALTTLLF